MVIRYPWLPLSWNPRDGEFEHIKPQQAERFDVDIWEEIIARWLDGQEKVLVGQVVREALGFESQRIGRQDQIRITAILQRLNWARTKKDWKGNLRSSVIRGLLIARRMVGSLCVKPNHSQAEP